MKGHLFALGAAALLAASACASGASTKEGSEPAQRAASESNGTKATVLLPKSYEFEPEVVEVAEGATVTWINEDDFPHTVRMLDGRKVDKPLGVGDSTSITFDRAGVFRYDCSLHPTQMSGEVIVRESSS